MDFTKFEKLKEIIALLGADPVDVELNKKLIGEGIPLDDPERIVVGETGLYYIDPRGLVTRVILYIIDKNIGWHKGDKGRKIREMVSQKEFNNLDLIKVCHKYHILNCNTQKLAEKQGWKDRYQVAKRLDGNFLYRFLSDQIVLDEVRNQHLNVCKNCLHLLSEITGGKYSVSNFTPSIFFNLKLNGLIHGSEVNPDSPPPPNIYPPDWQTISARYRKMKGYQCEGEKCPHPDLSAKHLRQYLHCHHINRDKQHNTFFNLKALCVYCHAKQPQHGHMKNSKQIKEYLLKIE